jgi:hypothetical protein
MDAIANAFYDEWTSCLQQLTHPITYNIPYIFQTSHCEQCMTIYTICWRQPSSLTILTMRHTMILWY